MCFNYTAVAFPFGRLNYAQVDVGVSRTNAGNGKKARARKKAEALRLAHLDLARSKVNASSSSGGERV